MIVSHKHRFIFVRAAKVGGTSLAHALSQYCGPDDVVASEDGFNPVVDDTPYEWKPSNSEGLWKHATVKEVRSLVTQKQWEDYRKVVVVRNPWDNFVSFFLWTINTYNEETMGRMGIPRVFGDFLWWNINGAYPLNKGHWMPEGKLWANFYVRFETLEDDSRRLFDSLGLSKLEVLPRMKTRPRLGRGHYSTYYSQALVDMVARKYAVEIEQFGYRFERI